MGHRELIEHLRESYAHRTEHIDISDGTPRDEAGRRCSSPGDPARGHRRRARGVIEMRDRGELADEVMRRLERDLDLEELRERLT